MQKINSRFGIKYALIACGAMIAISYLDPFTMKSIGNIVLNGERISQTYHYADDVMTGSIETSDKHKR